LLYSWRCWSSCCGAISSSDISDSEENDSPLTVPSSNEVLSEGDVSGIGDSGSRSGSRRAEFPPNEDIVGRFGVDLDWKPVGNGLPLL
jgi:hypothetical protein